MIAKLAIPALTAVAVLAIPAAPLAQQAPQQLPAEVQGWITELQQIQSDLSSVQQRVMQDPTIRSEQAKLAEQVLETMAEIDPTVPQQTERMATLIAQAEQAQSARNGAEMERITAEAQQIHERLARVQAEAMARPALSTRIEQFQARLHGRMLELEPGAEGLIRRHQELEKRVAEAMGRLTGR